MYTYTICDLSGSLTTNGSVLQASLWKQNWISGYILDFPAVSPEEIQEVSEFFEQAQMGLGCHDHIGREGDNFHVDSFDP